MKIGFASADWSYGITIDDHPAWGGAGWARLGQYDGLLPFEIVRGVPLFDSNKGLFGIRTWNSSPDASYDNAGGSWSGESIFDCDVIVMQRIMFREVAERICIARLNGQTIVNDVDDDLWGVHHTNDASKGLRVGEEENLKFYLPILQVSNIVTVSTKSLADKLTNQGVNVAIVPNYLQLSRFNGPREHHGLPVYGWVGSTAHRSNDLEQLRPVFRQMPGSQWHHSGAWKGNPKFSTVTKMPEGNITTSPIVSPQEYPDSFKFDIGIAPLNDVAFNYAKSNIKLLEYAASGIPFVASSIGEYRRTHKECRLGIVAESTSQWVRELSRLKNDQRRSEEMQRNLEIVQAYDISEGVRLLSQVYLNALQV